MMPDWYASIRLMLLYWQSFLGMVVFSYAIPHRKPIWKAILVVLVGSVICFLFGQYIYAREQSILGGFLRLSCMLTVYLVLFFTAHAFYKESGWSALSLASSGYAAQNIAGSFKTVLKLIPVVNTMAEDPVLILLLDLVCYGGTFLILFLAFRPYAQVREEDYDNKLKAIFYFVVMVVCIGMSRITTDNADRNWLAELAENMYSVFMCLLILIMQFGVMEQSRLTHNVDTMRLLLRQQRMQYETSKESVRLVNEKYHDLRKLLEGYSGVVSSQEIRKLEQQLEGYSAHIRTGSDVLDVVLSEKTLTCQTKDILLTSYVDGKDFLFMEELDLYALISNALNNAIEAVADLPEGRERFVSLVCRRDADVVSIHVENPCDGKVLFEDGIPKTQQDPTYHGFGIRSMISVAEKYGGSLAVKQAENMFYLDILLTVPKQ